MELKFKIEPLQIEETNNVSFVKLLPLSQEQQKIINPIVPPTSGIRMIIYEKQENEYIMPKSSQEMFLRVFKAISEVGKSELNKSKPNLLLVSDDRPSANHLVEYCAKIFAYEGYNIFFQETYDEAIKDTVKDQPFYSRMGTPHGSASVSLIEKIDLVIVLTASHNEMVWNGVKFYFELSIPISGRVMKAVSKKALEYEQIPLEKVISPQLINADAINNEYIQKMVEKIIDLSILKNTKVLLWPYMGRAPELLDLFTRIGMEVVLIDQTMEPPNPTVYIDNEKIQQTMREKDVKVAILVDADRDRVVFVIRNTENNTFKILSPNELYTAMHNLLSKELKKKLINVRTIPSDPRSDAQADLTFITGVGYKHLGMIVYGALGKPIDTQKFQTGILYVDTPNGNQKITDPAIIPQIIAEKGIRGENIIMVAWEESGGHTFNLLDIHDHEGKISITSKLPAIGDKYPAPAMLILCALIEMGHDLTKAIDQNIIGTRTTIMAEDEKKMKIVNHFAALKGENFTVNTIIYQVNTFEQVNGKIVVIHLKSENSDIYFRPSGTGPNVRIYIFGAETTAQTELEAIKEKITEMFP